MLLRSLVFFVIVCNQLFAEAYVNSEEIKGLLKKMEEANSSKSQVLDKTQIEIEEIQKKVNLSNEKKTLENADNSIGSNQDSIQKRVKSLEGYYSATTSLEEYIYTDNFSYQSICKNNTNCIVSASVEAEIWNQKIEKLNEKISGDKIAMAKSLQNVYPLEDKISLVKQVEQTTYSNTQMNSFNNTMMQQTMDDTKKKKYIEVIDGDILGNIKIKITPNYIKLSRK